MTRKKKIVITIVSALVAVLVLGMLAFTIYRNVQFERLRVFIVDLLLEQDGKSYSLSDRKVAYDATDIIAVYQFDGKMYTDFLLKNKDQVRDADAYEWLIGYLNSDDYTPAYTVILHSDEVSFSNGSSSQEGYYKCKIEIYEGEWSAYSQGPYININECAPTEFVRRIL